jgi:hypothetical protein
MPGAHRDRDAHGRFASAAGELAGTSVDADFAGLAADKASRRRWLRR